jgi:hypothetical protein
MLILDIIGTEAMLTWIRDIFSNIIKEDIANKITKNSKGNAYSLRICGKKAIRILDQLDVISIQRMNRKWRIYYECR